MVKTVETSYWKQRNRADALERDNIKLKAELLAATGGDNKAKKHAALGTKLKVQRLYDVYTSRLQIVSEASFSHGLYKQFIKELQAILDG